MTRAERLFWIRLRRRAARLEPDLQKAMLDGFEALRRSMTDAELLRMIETAEAVFDGPMSDQSLERAFSDLQNELQNGVNDATRLFGNDIGDGIRFNYLNPRFIDAIRVLNTRVMQTLKEGIRETVRQHIEQGLRDGVNPRTMARGLREVIGLAPNQEQAVANYRKNLEAGSRRALQYKLRDKRFDKATTRGELTREQIDRMTGRYRERWVKWNAEVNARTASIDAMKLGQRLSWEDAISKGIVKGGDLVETWVTAGDERVRESHQKMNGESKPFYGVYSNGQTIPGESEWGCRCVSRVSIRRRAAA